MWSGTGRRRPRPFGSVRTPAYPDGRLGGLPGPRDGAGPGALGAKRPKGIGGENQIQQGNFSQSGPGIEPHPKAHGRQGQVDENDLASGLHLSLPAGIILTRLPPKWAGPSPTPDRLSAGRSREHS